MNLNIEYKLFNNLSLPDNEALTSLHMALLPHSPVVLLGRKFMEKFYYQELPRQNLMRGVVVYLNEKPIGFIASTNDSAGFMKKAIIKKYIYLLYILAISVITDPHRILAIWEALQIMLKLPNTACNEKVGELLSLGVLPEYQSGKFQRINGVNISKELVCMSVNDLREWGCDVIRVVVDEDNTPAKFFYHAMGWELTNNKLKGWRVPSVEFSITL